MRCIRIWHGKVSGVGILVAEVTGPVLWWAAGKKVVLDFIGDASGEFRFGEGPEIYTVSIFFRSR